jgi:hypothetical protein
LLDIFEGLRSVINGFFPHLQHLLSCFITLAAQFFYLLLHVRRHLHLLLDYALNAEAHVALCAELAPTRWGKARAGTAKPCASCGVRCSIDSCLQGSHFLRTHTSVSIWSQFRRRLTNQQLWSDWII